MSGKKEEQIPTTLEVISFQFRHSSNIIHPNETTLNELHHRDALTTLRNNQPSTTRFEENSLIVKTCRVSKHDGSRITLI